MTSAVISPGADRSISASMSATRIGQSTTAGERRSITGPVHVACVDSHCWRADSMLARVSSIGRLVGRLADGVDLLGEIGGRIGERFEAGDGDVRGDVTDHVGTRRRVVAATSDDERHAPRPAPLARLAASQRLQEGDQPAAILDRRLAERRGRVGLAFAAVPQDRLLDRRRPPVVEQEAGAGEVVDEPDAPQRRRPPLLPGRLEVRAAVGEARAHVVEQQVGVRMDLLVGQRRSTSLSPVVCVGVWHEAHPNDSNSAAPSRTSVDSTSRIAGTDSVRP